MASFCAATEIVWIFSHYHHQQNKIHLSITIHFGDVNKKKEEKKRKTMDGARMGWKKKTKYDRR